MAGLKNSFISNFANINSLFNLNFLNRISNIDYIVPVYHTVSDLKLNHIKNIYQYKSIKQFESDLNLLLKYYKPIDFKDFLSVPNKNKKPYFFLTFDDGLSEFYNIIAPILKSKKISAICFLNDNFIDNKELFYRHKASLLIEHLNNIEIDNLTIQYKNISFNKKNAIAIINKVTYENHEFLDIIATKTHFSFENYLEIQKPYLTSKQINELIKEGFYFGSHSVSHPEYQHINTENQLKETINSILNLNAKFNLKYNTFAFPFTDYGVKKLFFENLKNQLKIDKTFGCAGIKKEEINNHIQRIPLEFLNLSAEKILKSELTYYFMSSIFKKHKIVRK